ncbi:hypothetical protein Taro_040636, partial [Colocasia esculenta]|nr:hypothetical protein [Colocasia esculenta]
AYPKKSAVWCSTVIPRTCALALHPPMGIILEAITTLRCCEDFSLERLGLLGDLHLNSISVTSPRMKKNPKFFIQIVIFFFLAYVMIVSSLI